MFVKLDVRVNRGLCYIECLSVCVHVLGRVRTQASVRPVSSFKRGNMLSLGIKGVGWGGCVCGLGGGSGSVNENAAEAA